MSEATTTDLLAGRTLVIAGVGPGHGGRIARAAVGHGAAVMMGARSSAFGGGLAAELVDAGARAAFRECDVTDDGSCRALVADAVSSFGSVDTVVANAMSGAGSGTEVESADFDEWSQAFDVNLFGALRIARAAFDELRSSPNGSVVFIGSQIVRRVFPGRGAYAASKAALLAAAQVLAVEVGGDGIRVNTVVPGRMWGPPLQAALPRLASERGRTEADELDSWVDATALGRLVTDEEVARTVVFLASDLAAAVTGQTVDVNGGETMS